MNTAALMGRLTADPEMRQTTNGINVVNFTLAVDRQHKSGEEKKTDFIRASAWRGTAEFISKWFQKGDMIAVTGELQSSSYTDNDGKKRSDLQVIVQQAYFCGGKRKDNERECADEAPEEDAALLSDDEGIPF